MIWWVHHIRNGETTHLILARLAAGLASKSGAFKIKMTIEWRSNMLTCSVWLSHFDLRYFLCVTRRIASAIARGPSKKHNKGVKAALSMQRIACTSRDICTAHFKALLMTHL